MSSPASLQYFKAVDALGASCLLSSHVFLPRVSEAASSCSRSKSHGSVVCSDRERGGIRSHRSAQRTREWVSFLLLVHLLHSLCCLSYIVFVALRFCWAVNWIILLKLKCHLLRLKTNISATDSNITVINMSSPWWCFELLVMHWTKQQLMWEMWQTEMFILQRQL